MSDLVNQSQNINELKFTTNSVATGEFVYSINKASNEIIIGGDNLIKIFQMDKSEEREKDIEKDINCILYENNKIFFNQEEKLYMVDYPSLENMSLLTTLSSNISNILYFKRKQK